MRKTILSEPPSAPVSEPHSQWLDLDQIASVEVSSEDAAAPIEHALALQTGTNQSGWRAGSPGPQTIRVLFDKPLKLQRVHVHFVEQSAERSQEFSFAVSSGSGEPFRDLHRQQFTFSPQGATEEREDYTVDLAGVKIFELRIDPDRSHDPSQSRTCATLRALRLA